MATVYLSMAGMFKAIEANGAINPHASGFKGRGYAEAKQYTQQGASEREQAATLAILERVDSSIERTRQEWQASVAGNRPVVAEVLAGMPTNMRRRAPEVSEAAPVRIVVETLVSAGVGAHTMARRGAAIAALVMRLGEVRPVELWTSWGMRVRRRDSDRGEHINVLGRCRIETQPLNVGQLVAVMCSPEWCRGMTFNILSAETNYPREYSCIDWAWGSDPQSGYRNERMRKELMLAPQDIFIPGGHLYESELMLRDPVAWVNQYLNAQRELAA